MAAPATDNMRDMVTFAWRWRAVDRMATCPAHSIVGDHLLPATQVPGTADAGARIGYTP